MIKKATEINLLGPIRLTQVMLPLVRRAKGRIIFMTSGLCRVASPVRGVHSGILSAIEALAACLKQELRPRGVDVVVVAPGEYTTGNSWLSDEKIREQARDMWAQLCQEQRNAYGEDYFETAVRSLEKYTKSQVRNCPFFELQKPTFSEIMEFREGITRDALNQVYCIVNS